MSESCHMDVEMVKGLKNMFFGGEGFLHTKVTGPGKVYIQSMPVVNTAARLSPYLSSSSSSSSSSSGGPGVNINFDT